MAPRFRQESLLVGSTPTVMRSCSVSKALAKSFLRAYRLARCWYGWKDSRSAAMAPWKYSTARCWFVAVSVFCLSGSVWMEGLVSQYKPRVSRTSTTPTRRAGCELAIAGRDDGLPPAGLEAAGWFAVVAKAKALSRLVRAVRSHSSTRVSNRRSLSWFSRF